jgi:hypothetical protein
VEGPAGMPCQPLAHLWMLVGSVVVDDGVDRFLDRYLRLNGIEEADVLLVPMALHVAADDGTVEDVGSSEQRGRTVEVEFVVVGHRSGTARLDRQTGLGAVERLYLAHMGICGSRCSDQDSMVNLRSSLLRIQDLSPFA